MIESTAAGRPPAISTLEPYLRAAANRGLTLTALRREVLALLWRERGPIGTYGIVDELNRAGLRRAHPNSIHRTLNTLVGAGLVIPIVSWKKFLLSPDPGCTAWFVSLCDRCLASACTPATNLIDKLQSICGERAFAVRAVHLECVGRCARCNQ